MIHLLSLEDLSLNQPIEKSMKKYLEKQLINKPIKLN